MEPSYEDYHCIYSTAPCEKCPFEQCVHDYHDGKHSFVARERRKILRDLRLKGWSVHMIAVLFCKPNKWVRNKIWEKEDYVAE